MADSQYTITPWWQGFKDLGFLLLLAAPGVLMYCAGAYFHNNSLDWLSTLLLGVWVAVAVVYVIKFAAAFVDAAHEKTPSKNAAVCAGKLLFSIVMTAIAVQSARSRGETVNLVFLLLTLSLSLIVDFVSTMWEQSSLAEKVSARTSNLQNS